LKENLALEKSAFEKLKEAEELIVNLKKNIEELKEERRNTLIKPIILSQKTEKREDFPQLAMKFGQKNLQSPRKMATKGLKQEDWPLFLQDWQKNKLKEAKLAAMIDYNSKATKESEKIQNIDQIVLKRKERQSYADKVSKVGILCKVSKELEAENWNKSEYFLDLSFLQARMDLIRMIYLNKNTSKKTKKFKIIESKTKLIKIKCQKNSKIGYNFVFWIYKLWKDFKHSPFLMSFGSQIFQGCSYLKSLKDSAKKLKNEYIQKRNWNDEIAFKQNLTAEEWKILVSAVGKGLQELKNLSIDKWKEKEVKKYQHFLWTALILLTGGQRPQIFDKDLADFRLVNGVLQMEIHTSKNR
jgi:hypothetical protein